MPKFILDTFDADNPPREVEVPWEQLTIDTLVAMAGDTEADAELARRVKESQT